MTKIICSTIFTALVLGTNAFGSYVSNTGRLKFTDGGQYNEWIPVPSTYSTEQIGNRGTFTTGLPCAAASDPYMKGNSNSSDQSFDTNIDGITYPGHRLTSIFFELCLSATQPLTAPAELRPYVRNMRTGQSWYSQSVWTVPVGTGSTPGKYSGIVIEMGGVLVQEDDQWEFGLFSENQSDAKKLAIYGYSVKANFVSAPPTAPIANFISVGSLPGMVTASIYKNDLGQTIYNGSHRLTHRFQAKVNNSEWKQVAGSSYNYDLINANVITENITLTDKFPLAKRGDNVTIRANTSQIPTGGASAWTTIGSVVLQ